MQTVIIVAALVTALFLTLILIQEILTKNEVQDTYLSLARLVESLKVSQKEASESKQKLYDYMDMTRAESLDSYRRGLQDGLSAAEKKPVYAPPNPVRTMEEHVQEKQDNEEARKANKEFSEGFQALMNYTGDLIKDGK